MKLIVSLTVISAVVISALFLRVSYLEKQANEVNSIVYDNYLPNIPTPVDNEVNSISQVAGEKFIPTPTTNPDPIITCKSKTGDIQVRKSVCSSYTDCPNGSGDYIFESQESCKKRWEAINQEFANLTDEYINAMRESNRLSKELLDLNLQKAQANFDASMNEAGSLTENLPEFEYTPAPSNIKIGELESTPTPDISCPGGGCYVKGSDLFTSPSLFGL